MERGKSAKDIEPGIYSHPEGYTYAVWGIADYVESVPETAEKIEEEAICVENYEKDHEIDGRKITLYRDGESLLFTKSGDIEAPQSVVAYEQLEGDKYYGQRWWRSVENFKQVFNKIDTSQKSNNFKK